MQCEYVYVCLSPTLKTFLLKYLSVLHCLLLLYHHNKTTAATVFVVVVVIALNEYNHNVFENCTARHFRVTRHYPKSKLALRVRSDTTTQALPVAPAEFK